MTTFIIFSPLVGAIFLLSLGRFFGKHGSIVIILTAITANLITVLYVTSQYNVIRLTNLGIWIQSGTFISSWSYCFDNLVLVMISVVLIVSSVVHFYSTDYMSSDPHPIRFLAYLSLFTFFMLILVTSDNLIGMFLGWEGVGLCSYLLISFWFTRISATRAASKAIIVNRVGDFGLTIGICLIFYTFQSVDFAVFLGTTPLLADVTFNLLYVFDINIIDAIAILLFVGAMAKSAQLFLHTWLPDAMEGPTPVSALIHAATMVTAGVFLTIRASIIFENSALALTVVTVIGALTCFFAATSGLVQSDIKKVIAYSTCSQLGYMFLACGLSGYNISLFHLSNHAFFKALLFLTAGAIIHSVANEQDMRRFGGLLFNLPITYMLLVAGSLSLMGFPFLTGYYSKDLIIEYAFGKGTDISSATALLAVVTAGITSFYSLRLIQLTFLTTSTNAFRSAIASTHESLKSLASLVPLVIGSLFLGYWTRDYFVGMGTNAFNNSIVIEPEHNTLLNAEFLSVDIKFSPLIISLGAAIPLLIVYTLFDHSWLWTPGRAFRFVTFKWYVDTIYNNKLALPVLRGAYKIFTLIDKGLIEFLGPTAYSAAINDLGHRVTHKQSGSPVFYAMFLSVSLLIILIVMLLVV